MHQLDSLPMEHDTVEENGSSFTVPNCDDRPKKKTHINVKLIHSSLRSESKIRVLIF